MSPLPPGTKEAGVWVYGHATALYCTVLYCTALHCTVLYCTVPGVEVGAVLPRGGEVHLLLSPPVVAAVLGPGVGPVVQHAQVAAVEGVEPAPRWM